MSNFFVVLVRGASARQTDQISKAFQANGMGWWHWFDFVWLLHSRTPITVTDIREMAKQAAKALTGILTFEKNPDILVLQVQPGDWTGYMPENYAEWLNQEWKAPPTSPYDSLLGGRGPFG